MSDATRRFGAMPVDETSCDLEPIHLAGAVQPPVVMVIARGDRIDQISENAAELVGREPTQLVGASIEELPEPFPGLLRAAAQRPVGRIEVRREGGWTYVGHHHQGLTIAEAEPDGGAIMPTELLNRLRLVVDEVDRAPSFGDALTAACDAVRELTGFDRVMVYVFHDDGHGEVVAESVEDGVDSFLGLHYPATDIPRQARRLFVINPTRVIADTTYDGAALLGRPDSEPADLTYAQFRATSPIHLEYLRNMGVAASFSLSLVVDGELVGLIAAHHEAARRAGVVGEPAGGLVV
ncbi:MAG: GAF domain-containing protein, partial [Actinomycetota bacterium]